MLQLAKPACLNLFPSTIATLEFSCASSLRDHHSTYDCMEHDLTLPASSLPIHLVIEATFLRASKVVHV